LPDLVVPVCQLVPLRMLYVTRVTTKLYPPNYNHQITVACTGLLTQPSWFALERWLWLTFLYH